MNSCHTLASSFIAAAVKRLYENVRRLYVEQGSGKENYVENQTKRRKYRSRRQRVNKKPAPLSVTAITPNVDI